LTSPGVLFRLFGGVCSTAWLYVKWHLKTSARLNDFSAEEPEPGQKPDHGALEVSESVPVFTTLLWEALDMIVASSDGEIYILIFVLF
jgi:hypothetical protein